MLPTLESLTSTPPVDSGTRPLPWTVWAIGITAAALVVAGYLLSFPIENRHPIDAIDVVRESANFFGIVTVAVMARRDIRLLNVGFVILLSSFWMEVVDEFTWEPYWIGTLVPAILGITGIVLVAIGVREASKRREETSALRARAEEGLRRSLTTLRAVVESTPDAVWVKGADGRFMLVNSAYAVLVGRDAGSIIGRAEAELYASQPDASGRAVARALESGGADRFEATVAGDDVESSRTFLVSRSAFKDESGRGIGVLGIARDISDRKAVEERLYKQAHHDALTGLANRAAFTEHLARALSRFKHRPERKFAVLYVDIDRFKDINDRHGHAVGDQLLTAFAKALYYWVRPEDFIARLGGDEFTILLHEVTGHEAAEAIADRIIEGLRTPFELAGARVSISASIGVAISAPATDSPDLMLRAADAAMYRAKDLGRGRHVLAGT